MSEDVELFLVEQTISVTEREYTENGVPRMEKTTVTREIFRPKETK